MRLGSPTVRWLVSLVLASCWVASVLMPVAVTIAQNGEQSWQGYGILIMGWLGPLMYQFAWLANPLLPCVLILAVIGTSSEFLQKLSVIAAVLLALLAFNALFWNQIPMDNGENPIVRFQIGYYLWLVAMFGGAIWGLTSAFMAAKKPPPD